MKKLNNFNGNFEYELLGENQQVVALREKLAILYSSPFSDILLWELYDSSLINGYYKLFYYEQSVLKHIILFKYSAETKKKVFVINKEFKISLKNIENICHILFYEFTWVQQIIFEKVFGPKPKQAPKMVFERTSNDVIIPDLPKTMYAYMKSLETHTRKEINRKINRISKDIPDFKIQYIEKSDIVFEQINKIVSFNRSRMKTKGKISDLNDTECKVLHQYISTSGFGFLCVCVVNGKIISGTINTVIGEHAYSHVIAHDNTYNQYSVGQITMVNTTKYLIEEKNIKYHHLLCGTLKYKFQHGGINHDLYTFRVFRNNNVHYFWRKAMIDFKNNYRKFRKKMKKNKTIYDFYIKFNKMKSMIKLINPL